MKIGNFLIMFCAAIIFHGVFLARVRQAGNRLWDFPLELAEQAADFLIQQSQTPFTISQPGIYRLIESLNVTGSTVITISASNVVLDLNGKALAGNTTAIAVVGAQSNITIQNGFITGSPFQTGISVPTGCTNIILKNLNMNNFAGALGGISITGSSGIAIRDCFVTQSLSNAATLTLCHDVAIRDCNFYANGQYGLDFEQSFDARVNTCMVGGNSIAGIRSNASHNITIEDTIACDNGTVGFEFVQSNTNSVRKCQALDNGGITGTGSIIESGFFSLNGIGNVFENCIANGTTTTATNAASQVAGFALLGSEKCSKIINCESGNTTSPIGGSAIPYGILLGAVLDNLNTTTWALFDNNASQIPEAIAWHPNSQLFAIAGITNPGTINLQLFEYNRTLQQLIAHFSTDLLSVIEAIAWSPDGNYLAIGGIKTSNVTLTVFSLERINKTLTQLTGCNVNLSSSVTSIAWTSDGQFLAVAGGTNNALFVYKFDTSALTLTRVGTPLITGVVNNGVSWSLDGNYIATVSSGGIVSVYSFDKSIGINILTLVSTQSHGAALTSVAWSRDGDFLLVGGSAGTGGNTIRVYQFNKQTQTLSLVGSQVTVDAIQTIVWSPNDRYIAAGGTASLYIFLFDRNVNQIELLESITPGNSITSLSWSKDGRYIVFCGGQFSNGGSLEIINALQFPNNNMVLSNTAYCNVGNQYPGGVGISGSSIQNLIVSNLAYQNTFNYEFVTNGFVNGLDGLPTLLQNISIPPFDEP